MKKQKFTLNASLLRLILSGSLFLSTIVAGGGFVYVQEMLKKYAVEVSHKRIDAAASNGNIQSLERIKTDLENNQDVSLKAQALKATNELPQFTIVENVTMHATNNNIKITNFDFTDAGKTAPLSGATTPQPSTSPSQTAQTPSTTTTPTPAKYVSISVTIETPVNYANFLQFLHDLEQNVPKMQVQGVSLTPATSGSSITSTALTIQMYTR